MILTESTGRSVKIEFQPSRAGISERKKDGEHEESVSGRAEARVEIERRIAAFIALERTPRSVFPPPLGCVEQAEASGEEVVASGIAACEKMNAKKFAARAPGAI